MLEILIGATTGVLLAHCFVEYAIHKFSVTMPSRFRIQIVDTYTNEVCEFEPGLQVEKDLVASCIEKTVAKGVGIFRTRKRVEAAIRQGIQEAVFELKKQVKPHYHV